MPSRPSDVMTYVVISAVLALAIIAVLQVIGHRRPTVHSDARSMPHVDRIAFADRNAATFHLDVENAKPCSADRCRIMEVRR